MPNGKSLVILQKMDMGSINCSQLLKLRVGAFFWFEYIANQGCYYGRELSVKKRKLQKKDANPAEPIKLIFRNFQPPL